MRRTFVLAAGLAAATAASVASAHARLKPTGTLKPRSDSSGLKTGPCGSVAVDETKRVTLEAGDTLAVQWEETINHPGSFKFSFSENGATGFESNLLKEVPDTQDGSVTFDDPSTYHQYTTTLEVPDITCDKCAIQLIQVMTESTPPTFYYSCADIKITGGSTTAGDDTDTSTGSTTATSTSTTTSSDGGSSDKPDSPSNLQIKVKRKAASATGSRKTKDESSGEQEDKADGSDDEDGDADASSLSAPEHAHEHAEEEQP
jgi:predicted carbohydrate-binding protein with CBM5 and CBM33 domain